MAHASTPSAILALCLAACGNAEPHDQAHVTGEGAAATMVGGKADEAGRTSAGDVVALALSELDPAAPPLDPASLLGVTRQIGRGEVSTELRAAAVGAADTLGARLVETGSGTLRVDRWSLDAGLGPGRGVLEGRPVVVPVRLSGSGTVEVARLFADADEATRAALPGLDALPFDAARARALPEGTVVTVPVEARFAVNADGALLRRAATQDARFGAFARVTTLGAASSVAQGMLVLSGRAVLQVARLSGSRVRLRLRAGAELDASARVEGSLGAHLTATFVPGDVLDRARALRRAVDAGRLMLGRPQRAAERLQVFAARAPLTTRRLLDLVPGPPAEQFETRALDTSDAAAALASDLATPLESLDAQALNHLDAPLSAASQGLERVERLAVRTLDLRAVLSLDAGVTRTLGAVGDFELDLANPEAAAAYDRAASGRVVWRGPTVGELASGTPLLDLTTLDALADAPADPERPAVVRWATAASDMRERRFALHLATPIVQTSFSGSERVNSVTVREGAASPESWVAHLWTREHVPGFGEEVHDSGFFAPADGDLARGGYFFGWRRDYGPWEPEPVRRSLDDALNLLGRRGVTLGVPALYAGESPGAVRAALDVVVTGDALSAFFDPARATPAALWRALGTTAQTWDNEFGLPYLASARRPADVDALPEAAEACEVVAAAWGGRWCLYFAEDFLPALQAARHSADPLAAMRFLEDHYRAGLLANPVGARLLVRYLSEVLVEIGASDGVHVRLDVRNPSDASAAGSPGLRLGDAPAGALIEALGVARRD